MKILVAPLNWGLGHASRCVPLVQQLTDEGNEVILGGDGESLTLLRRHFPSLRYVYLAPLHLLYSASTRQVWAMLKAFPHLLAWSIKDHTMLKALLREEHIDQVVSDNRFGLFLSDGGNGRTQCFYITHQLHIMLPRGWKWAEGIASRLHARIYAHFDKVWVPDYSEYERSLAGELSHPSTVRLSPRTVQYIGPLSRLSPGERTEEFDTVAVLSGPEPQRSLLEQDIKNRYAGTQERVLIVQGQMNKPNTRIKRGNITIVPYLDDRKIAKVFLGAKHIIVRSGYSTIMDLNALGLLRPQPSFSYPQVEFIPTPGQPEQDFLASWVQKRANI